jgi:hypothetical protein
MLKLPRVSLLGTSRIFLSFFVLSWVSRSEVPPLDPLSSSEIGRAENVVRRDGDIAKQLGGQSADYRICLVELSTSPPESGRTHEHKRLARVVLYNRHGVPLRGVEALVDVTKAGAENIIDHRVLEARQIPIAAQDLVEALELVNSSSPIHDKLPPELRHMRLENENIDVRVETEESALCKVDERCLSIEFHRGDQYLRSFSVIVNLTKSTATTIDN